MRAAFLLTAVIGLGGCSTVESIKPWFAASDAQGAAPLHPGVWSVLRDQPCKFQEQAPVSQWPLCTGVIVVRERDLLILQRDAGQLKWQGVSYVLAAGDPRILEMGAPDAAASEAAAGQWLYLGVEPVSKDSQGRITKLSYWPVLCSGGAAKAPASNGAADSPEEPTPTFPGLKSVDNGDCVADSKQALSEAARISRQSGTSEARWIRDGDR